MVLLSDQTLAAPRLVAQIKEAQELVQPSGVSKEAQVWISSDLGLEQSGKSTPAPLA